MKRVHHPADATKPANDVVFDVDSFDNFEVLEAESKSA